MIKPASSLWRLALMMLGIVVAALSLMLVLTTWALNSSLDTVARTVIRDELEEYSGVYDRDGLEGLRRAFSPRTNGREFVVRLFAPSGKLLFRVDLLNEPLDLPINNSRNLIFGETRWISSVTGPRDSLILIGGRGMQDGSQLWIGRVDLEDRALVARVRRLVWLSAVVTTLLAAGPVIWFARQVLRPVKRLIHSAHNLAQGDKLDKRLESTPAIPELQEFSTAFNASLDRVSALTHELEAANDHLAHELRTPLARIRGNIEAALMSNDVDTIHDAAARGVEEIERSVALVQSILSIRAGDARSMKLHLELAPLGTLVADMVELFQAAAETRGITLTMLTDKNPLMVMDQQRIRQALSNLLDNALAYTPSDGVVTVAVEMDHQWVMILVRDTGPGLTEADMQKIWLRFSRGSAAKNTASASGIGLGLSLVRAVAHVHHGKAEARNREGGGAEFGIYLPLPAEPVAKG